MLLSCETFDVNKKGAVHWKNREIDGFIEPEFTLKKIHLEVVSYNYSDFIEKLNNNVNIDLISDKPYFTYHIDNNVVLIEFYNYKNDRIYK